MSRDLRKVSDENQRNSNYLVMKSFQSESFYGENMGINPTWGKSLTFIWMTLEKLVVSQLELCRKPVGETGVVGGGWSWGGHRPWSRTSISVFLMPLDCCWSHVDDHCPQCCRPLLKIVPRKHKRAARVKNKNKQIKNKESWYLGNNTPLSDGNGLLWWFMKTTLLSSVLEGDKLTSDISCYKLFKAFLYLWTCSFSYVIDFQPWPSFPPVLL